MKKLNLILFTLIYIAASIVLMGNAYHPLAPGLLKIRYAVIFIVFAIFIFIYLLNNRLRLYRFSSLFTIYIFIIWIIFSMTVAWSEIIHQTFPLQGVFFLFVVPFIYFMVMPYLTRKNHLIIFHALFAANLLYIVISYFTTPIEYIPYWGIAANPNGFGQISAITAIAGYFTLTTLPKRRKIGKLLLLGAILLSIFSVIISSSRTSMVVVGIITVIITFYTLMARRMIWPLILIAAAGLVGWFSPVKDLFLSEIIGKFSTSLRQGELLSGRAGIWETVWKEATLFGNGEDYFNKFFEGAHNSIIYILGVYGIIPAIALIVFFVLLVLFSFHYLITKKTLLPFVIILTFTLFSMTEGMFGIIGSGMTVAFYHAVGILFFHEDLKGKVKTIE